MSKITAFNKQNANQLSDEVVQELAALGKKHGIVFKWKGGTLDSANLTMKIQASIVNSDGSVEWPEARDFKRYTAVHGIPLSALGKKFDSKGKTYILRGYNPSAPKFPFSAEAPDGQVWRLTKHSVERAFGNLNTGAKPTVAQKPAANDAAFAKGDKVKAKWKDGKMYDAVYVKVGVRPGFHRVKFEDGTIYGTNVLKKVA